MSDETAAPAPSAPAADSGPTTTADVASAALDRLESQEADAGVEVSGETPAPADDTPAPRREMLGDNLPDDVPAPSPEKPPEPPKQLTEAEQLLADAGYPSERWPDGKPRYIPHHKVRTIIENALRDGKGQFGAQLQTVSQERDALRADLTEMYQDLRGDPEAFLVKLANADPRYGQMIQRLMSGQQNGNGHQPPAPQSEMPPPDINLGNGNWTYSREGLERRDAWVREQMLGQLRQEVQSELAPIKQREQAEQRKAQTREHLQQLYTQTTSVMADAETWPGWTENAPQILKVLQDDSAQARATGQPRKLSLEAAYRQVVIPRLIETDTQKRARLLREGATAPRSPAIGRAGGEQPRQPGPSKTADIASRALSRLERGGG